MKHLGFIFFVAAKILLVAAALLLLPGCMSIERVLNGVPLISAQELHIEKNSAYLTVRVDATNYTITQTEVTADELAVTTGTPLTGSMSFRAIGYRRVKRLYGQQPAVQPVDEPPPAPPAPPPESGLDPGFDPDAEEVPAN